MNLLSVPLVSEFVKRNLWLIVWNKYSRVNLRYKIDAIPFKEKLKSIEEKYKDCWIFIPRLSFGDICIFASYLKEFRKKSGGMIIVLVGNDIQASYVNLFEGVDEVIVVGTPLSAYLNKLSSQNQKLQKGKTYRAFAPYLVENRKLVNLAEDYRYFLNLFDDAIQEIPKIKEDDSIAAAKLFEDLRLKEGKTIFLSPFSQTFNHKDLSIDFWKKLADTFVSRGYSVVFNSNGKSFSEYKNTFLPLSQIIPFVALCGYSISFRSGLSDVIANSNLKNITVFYPHDCGFVEYPIEYIINQLKQNYIWDDTKKTEENILNIYSLNSIFSRNDIDEIIFNEKEEDKLIDNLINKYVK